MFWNWADTLFYHTEILFFELNLRNLKWLVCCSYNPHKNLIKEHLRVLTEGIQFYSKDYENILLMGDSNAEITKTNMSSFCEIYHLTDIIKQSTCFKNPSNPSGIHIEFFKNIFLKVLNKHAPIKTKYLRANHSPFVTRELSKTVMLKSKLQNQYLKCKSEEARVRYKIHRNLCVTLLRT